MVSCTCTDEDRLYVGDVGTVIDVDTCIDLSGASSVSLLVRKPDGTVVTWSGSVADTTKIRHTVGGGDLDQAGEYRVQAHAEVGGWTGRGRVARFVVCEAFG